MIKKGQHDKVILMGMGMQINNNFCRSSTEEESLVSDNKFTTSSSMSSTRKESTQTGTHFDSIIK
jgi:hypothetical protein